MIILWLVLALLLLTALLGALARTVRGDGLGHREPPRSHVADVSSISSIRAGTR